MQRLLAEMGNPHREMKFVHVAGTNGKGSTAAYLGSMLRCAGYRTGLYISPYIQRFGERIQVDGEAISESEIASSLTEVAAAAECIARQGGQMPTVFELVTAMGFDYFRRKACDIVVLEVGLGGRLDATNIIEAPEAAVITRIGLDHTDILGDTVTKIAAEKGGIIKPGCDAVIYDQSAEAMQVLEAICAARGPSFTGGIRGRRAARDDGARPALRLGRIQRLCTKLTAFIR
jgi:dihydrofolate synthase/folylpolyglutamate synthase